jgi:hypothetical protein
MLVMCSTNYQPYRNRRYSQEEQCADTGAHDLGLMRQDKDNTKQTRNCDKGCA